MQTVQHLVDYWDSRRLLSLGFLTVGLSLLLQVVWLLRSWRRYHSHHVRERPFWTFRRVAISVGLDWRQQWILIRIARQQGLVSPLALLLPVATLRHHAQRYVESIGPRRCVPTMGCIAEIYRRLLEKPHVRLDSGFLPALPVADSMGQRLGGQERGGDIGS